MTTSSEKLTQDITILQAMTAEMDTYLNSDVLFWRLPNPQMPALTLGGYLMRQQRLLALPNLLDMSQRAEVDTAVTRFNQALVNKIVRFEQKAHKELGARIRQWGEFLNDVERGTAVNSSNYATTVEVRVMIAALVEALSLAPYQLELNVASKVNLLDTQLRRRFAAGEFVWPAEWEPAYPTPTFWFLYGAPQQMNGR